MHLPTGIQMWTEPEPEGSLTSISGDDSSSDTGKCSRVDRKYKRREKNRAAAQKSRKKQTERADALHQELQSLERSNTAYEKEIAFLRLEIERYDSALKQHEPHCCIFTFSSPKTLLSAPSPAPAPTPSPAAAPPTGFALPDLLDSAEWPQLWDTVW
ncbi:basic leucine zipper transcriptional factor ATF-like [Anguilla anguilla]|uniref:basic leucine zipper transcriptional factor ATF-like n=1 Tax=Anguilla anguilla TaxID=7936 RepID=UPI0015ADBC61|nr:basic leucine zipper transcriptional factor ATF-like [Anguilla anguilla]